MPEHPDILIIGGGVIGLTTAYFLAREKIRVTVVDKGDFGREASWAGAGILPPGKPAPHLPPYDQLRAHSAVMFPALAKELRDWTGVDNGYLCCSGLELGPGDPAVEEDWRAEGITFKLVQDEELRRLEPALSPNIRRAYFLPEVAQLRNPRHIKALLAACALLGVQFRPGCPCHGFDRDGERITALRTGTGPMVAGRFLVAAGAWSEGLLEPVGWRPGTRPVRGQIALLNTSPPLLANGRVLAEGKRYLVPRPDGRVLVGSTEEDAGFDKRNTARAIGDLLAFALSLVPGLAGAHLERCWAGLRPGSPDGLPFMGLVPGFENLFVAAGHFRAGIQLSPATALVLKELFLGQPLTVPLEAFRPDRRIASDSGR
jgi:glycine oxidase